MAAEVSPELLGVGYIIGPKIGGIMLGGGIMAYWLLIPMIKFFGEGLPLPLAPGTIPIAEMSPDQIRSAYVLYIGAGAVAAGGIFSLIKSLPVIWHGLRQGLASATDSPAKGPANHPRTDRDLSLKAVGVGIILVHEGAVTRRLLAATGVGEGMQDSTYLKGQRQGMNGGQNWTATAHTHFAREREEEGREKPNMQQTLGSFC